MSGNIERPRGYVVWALDEEATNYDNSAGTRPNRRSAEEFAIEIVRGGQHSAVVQRMFDGRIISYFDREEIDNIGFAVER